MLDSTIELVLQPNQLDTLPIANRPYEDKEDEEVDGGNPRLFPMLASTNIEWAVRLPSAPVGLLDMKNVQHSNDGVSCVNNLSVNSKQKELAGKSSL